MRTISEQKTGRTGVALGWSWRITGLTKVLGGILFFALLHNPVQALSATVPPGQSVTLAWNPSTDPTVVGYNLYYGGASGNYTNKLFAGNDTNITVSGLVEGDTYYFAATTYNSSGVQSPFSNEVAYTVTTNAPAPLLSVTPTSVTSTKQFVLTVTGTIGHTNEIQASTNLVAWTIIGTMTVGTNGSFTFTDTNAPKYWMRFYRTVDIQP